MTRAASARMTQSNASQYVGAAVAGAALMYFFDPQRGNRRQKRLRDKLVHAGHVSADFLGTARRDTANRVRGLSHEARGAFDGAIPDDRVLEERVRAELGRVVSHPGAMEVEAIEGVVLLRGYALAHEHGAILEGASGVRGVIAVEDHLDVRETAENIPALQGEGRLREKRFELAQENWAPATRLATGFVGAVLASYGRRQRGIVGMLSTVGGAALLTRAVRNA
jgi:osmotically-inducible protein OsmY